MKAVGHPAQAGTQSGHRNRVRRRRVFRRRGRFEKYRCRALGTDLVGKRQSVRAEAPDGDEAIARDELPAVLHQPAHD